LEMPLPTSEIIREVKKRMQIPQWSFKAAKSQRLTQLSELRYPYESIGFK
jgi:hypothetical protein